MKTRKNAQSDLAFLRSFAQQKPASQRSRPPLLEKFFVTTAQKLELRWKITERYSSPYTETWIAGPYSAKGAHFGVPIKYDYQRISLRVNNAKPQKFIYPNLRWPSKLKANGYFTSSGQVALTSVFSVLGKYYPKRIRVFSDLYWETLDGLINEGWKDDRRAKVALIDSSLLEASLGETLRGCRGIKALILDTTCWVHNDPRVSQVMAFCAKHNVKLFMCRSHLKLDSLGMEYGRLGSIVWSHGSKESARDEEMNKALLNTLRRWGGFASTSQFYPFWTNKKFHKENEKWIAGMREANGIFATEMSELKHKHVGFRKFDHQIFSWIECKSQSKKRMNDLLKMLLRALRFSGVPAGSVASYPWDFVAVTMFSPSFRFSLDTRPMYAIRVSLPGVSSEDAHKISQIFKRWMIHVDNAHA